MHKVVSSFVKGLGLPVSKAYCSHLIESHPDFPSILSISDTLDNLGIGHKSYSIENLESIKKLTLPFLLQDNREGGKIIPIENDEALINFESSNKDWKGVVIKIFSEEVLNPNLENEERLGQERSMKRNMLLLAVSIIVLISVAVYDINLFSLAYLLTSLVGCFFGFLLLSKDLGIENSKIESFCYSKKQNRSGCDDLLTSSGSSFLGFKLSELVLSFFVSQLLVLVIGGSDSDVLMAIYLFNVISIPFVIFSLYYQYFKAKVWCRLCLVVALICVVQVILLFNNIGFGLIPTVEPIAVLLACFVVILSLIRILKVGFFSIEKEWYRLIRYSRLLGTADTFWSKLSKETKVDYELSDFELRVGSVDAPIQLMLVGNLYCNPCSEYHDEIRSICETYAQEMSLCTRFILSGKDFEDNTSSNQYLIEYWLTNIHRKGNESELTNNLITDWYKEMDLEKFKRLYPIDGEISERSERIQLKHSEWIENVNIPRTPTLYINGFKLPRDYRLDDFRNVIPNLVEFLRSNKIG